MLVDSKVEYVKEGLQKQKRVLYNQAWVGEGARLEEQQHGGAVRERCHI